MIIMNEDAIKTIEMEESGMDELTKDLLIMLLKEGLAQARIRYDGVRQYAPSQKLIDQSVDETMELLSGKGYDIDGFNKRLSDLHKWLNKQGASL